MAELTLDYSTTQMPLSRVETLLHLILQNGGGSGSGSGASGIDPNMIRELSEIQSWLDRNNVDFSDLMEALKTLNDKRPYAKVEYVDEIPAPEDADENTIYIVKDQSSDGGYSLLRYKFVDSVPDPEDAEEGIIYLIKEN